MKNVKITITLIGFHSEEKKIAMEINKNEMLEDVLKKVANNLRLQEEIFCEDKVCPWVMIIADGRDITSLNMLKEKASNFRDIKILCLL